MKTIATSVQLCLRVYLHWHCSVDVPSLLYSSIQSLNFYYAYSLHSSSLYSSFFLIIDANGLQDYISFGQQVPSSGIVIRNQTELNRIPSDVEDLWIANFEIAKQKNLIMKQQHSMKKLTIGINALNGITVMELNGLEALERVIVMRGGLSGESGRLRVTNCANLISIDIGEYAFMKYKNLELTNLPLLRTFKLENNAFQNIQNMVMESNGENEMMNQICLHFSRFNWEITPFKEIVATNAR